jgi:predicted TIM-barrel fold metal-dependent hydrolase
MADVDRSIPFVETHFHVWELGRFRYPWLEEPGVPEQTAYIGDYRMLRQDWGPPRLFREFHGANVRAAVHVEADYGGPDPVEETVWLESVAREFGMPDAIVAYTDLERDGADAELDRHLAASDRVKGVRIRAHPSDPFDAVFQRSCRALATRGLSYDMNASPGRLLAGRATAVANPDLQIVLCHTGNPVRRDPDYFALWRQEISALAEAPNVACKISGLGMGDHGWTVDSLRPWVLHALEAFGLDRAMFGTNWPVDALFAPYIEQVDAYRTIVAEAGLRADEQAAVLSGNAERVYRI